MKRMDKGRAYIHDTGMHIVRRTRYVAFDF